MSFQIRIRTMHQPPKQSILKIEPNDTLSSFKYTIHKVLFTDKNDNNNKKQEQACKNYENMELLNGFPPKKIIFHNLEDDHTILLKDCQAFQPNETIFIRWTEDENNSNDKNNDKSIKNKKRNESIIKEETNSTQSSSTIKRPRRTAATVAMNSFKDTIKAQNAIMRKEAAAQQKSKKKNTKVVQKTGNVSHFHSAKSNKKISSSSSSQFGKNNNAQNKTKPMKNEEDVTMQLLSATAALTPEGNGGSKVNQIIRKAMKNAVTQAYETSRAFIRLSAIQSGRYTIMKKLHSNDNSSTASTGRTLNSHGVYTITYEKGDVDGGRGDYTEEIEIISLEALTSVIQTVYNDSDALTKEMLRGNTMAQVSPRVFWSLIYHYTTNTNYNKTTEDDMIPKALKYVTPELNYDYLSSRKKTMSQKAKDNLWQNTMFHGEILKEGATIPEHENENEEALNVIQDVEQAMMNTLSDGSTRVNKRNRMASAALSRFDTTPTPSSSIQEEEDSWTIQTPTEYDEDELRTCLTTTNDINEQPLQEEIINQYIKILIHKTSIHNWRELANANPSSLFDTFTSMNNNNTTLSKETIELWIANAQMESIGEIMIEIVDSNPLLFLKLRDDGNCGTPKDLSFFHSIPSVLCNLGLRIDDDENEMVEEEQVKIWCKRSLYVLKKWIWLEDYVTPV